MLVRQQSSCGGARLCSAVPVSMGPNLLLSKVQVFVLQGVQCPGVKGFVTGFPGGFPGTVLESVSLPNENWHVLFKPA